MLFYFIIQDILLTNKSKNGTIVDKICFLRGFMFFEGHHSTERNYFYFNVTKNTKEFPLHIHRAFECYSVISGRATAIINGIEYFVCAGESVLVFPYQRHEYKTEPNTATEVCIFSPDLVGSYKEGSHTVPESNKFNYVPDGNIPDSLLLKKAHCYKILGIFDKNAKYTDKVSGEDDLLSSILSFISSNYSSECTLETVSRHVGYDYSYISKFFKRMTGTNFKNYINGLRISEACRLLEEEKLSIQDIAEAAGFKCTRTFNREFLKVTGTTPSTYLNNHIR